MNHFKNQSMLRTGHSISSMSGVGVHKMTMTLEVWCGVMCIVHMCCVWGHVCVVCWLLFVLCIVVHVVYCGIVAICSWSTYKRQHTQTYDSILIVYNKTTLYVVYHIHDMIPGWPMAVVLYLLATEDLNSSALSRLAASMAFSCSSRCCKLSSAFFCISARCM